MNAHAFLLDLTAADDAWLDAREIWTLPDPSTWAPEDLHPASANTGPKKPARGRQMTHCLRGHELAGENVYVAPDGHRRCRTCNANRKRGIAA